MKALMNSKVCKAISVFTIVSFFISCSLTSSMAGALQSRKDPGGFREPILKIMDGYSEEAI